MAPGMRATPARSSKVDAEACPRDWLDSAPRTRLALRGAQLGSVHALLGKMASRAYAVRSVERVKAR